MYTLIIDSATKVLYIALVKDNTVLYEKYNAGKNDHAKSIVYLIDEALNQNNIEAKDLDKVVVGYGPGSYTGVRMGVAIGKMLAVFMKKPLYTISTLELMASGYDGRVVATIDARRGNSFGALYDIKNEAIIKQEGLYVTDELKANSFDYEVTEDSYRVNPFYVIKHAALVAEPHLLVPNYLRETEAERNLDDKKI